MKQLVQNLRTGKTTLLDVPVPLVKKGHVLIKTKKSLVSLGTERMLVEFGGANWLGKIRQQPEKFKMVLDKMSSDGFQSTFKAVFRKLDQPIPLGYCNVGIVTEIGEGVNEIRVGDRVVSNGSHAEMVCVSQNLVAKIPDHISDTEATFSVIGSVALNAIKLLNPKIGETVVVIGTGLIGLLTLEILRARKCLVVAVDIDEEKLEMVRSKGMIAFNSAKGNVESFVSDRTNGKGVDGVIITASSKSNRVISQAAKMLGKHGKMVLTGVTGLDLVRADFYEKELQFQVSCSYGERSAMVSNPAQSVASQNFTKILDLIGSGKLDVNALITQTVPFTGFAKIYGEIGRSGSVASILDYSDVIEQKRVVQNSEPVFENKNNVIGIIGAGNFVNATLLPLLKGSQIKYIVSENGLSATTLAQKYNIAYVTTDYETILNDPEINLVMICTRHDLHAKMVMKALKAGKHVFVEKPLAIFPYDLDEIIKTRSESAKNSLTVGFNRKFSPLVQKIKSLLNNAPMNITATMNAGFISADSWVHDREIGGGRIIGEACHLIDLVTYIAGSKIKAVCMNAMGSNPSDVTDNASILLKYENGSTGTIHYFSNGNRDYSKERIEIYVNGQTLILDNFKTLTGYGFKGFSKMKIGQDKGHEEQFRQLLESGKSDGKPLIPFEEIVNVTKATFAALESLKNESWIRI